MGVTDFQTAGAVEMTRATRDDVADIVALRDHLATWMVAQGIDQWKPGEYPASMVADEVDDGQWYIRREDSEVIATVRVVYSDVEFWGDDVADAGYIHGLMVAPSHRRGGLGRQVVAFAEQVIAEAGKSLVRLDTATTNAVLMAYYPSLGFRAVREAALPPRFGRDMSVTLFEKPT